MTFAAVSVLAAACAAWLLAPVPTPRPRTTARATTGPRAGPPPADRLHRWRLAWSGASALAGWAWLSGLAGSVIGVVVGVVVWVVIGRAEPASTRRARLAARAELPHLVALFGATLRGGAAPDVGLQIVCAAMPGPAADRLSGVRARLAVGVDPASVWGDLAADAVLGRLGRTLARAHASGAPVADAVVGLSRELARDHRARAEDRARAVGVKAALPLGLCLLPAFLLIGIVPVVAGLLTSLLAS